MSFIAKLQRAREILEQQGRLSTRALERELAIGGDELDELIEELVDVQQVAHREGKVLVWAGPSAAKPSGATKERGAYSTSPTRRADADRPADTPEARGAEVRGAEARKVVTIVFADLIGSTSLHERLDAESVTRLMERYYRAMRGAVAAHGGTVVKLMGDGVMAAFGVPRVAEDDAIRAVRAGVAMQDAFRELARDEFAAVGAIGLRVGINTGEVVVSADNTDVVGDPVNVAARLQTEAHDGEVVIGESTRRLVAALVTLAPLGSFALKGRAEAMKAYRIESLDRPVCTTTAAFVGRDEELARINAVYEAALATPAARLAVLLGSPGLGKSRLLKEVTRRLGDAASVVTAQCDAAGGATFAPVAEALREFLLGGEEGEEGTPLRVALEAVMPATDAERPRIIDGITALLAGSPASPEETFFVIRRLLSGLAAPKPVVLVIDDLQWAEPLLLDLLEHLVQWGSGVPLLVLVGARPELRDVRSSLVTPGGLVSDVITLSGLDAGAAMRLAANVIGAADLPATVAAKVLATSEGNPLFVGELVRMLVDEGAIERQGERWIVGANLASLEMPPTIHALLAARIERLRPEERTVLERAAVVGRHFSRSAVAALLGRNGGELDARLEGLRRTQLIERDAGWFLGEPVLRFHHVLIRDAAYRRLLKGTRAELHEQLANWIEAQVKDAAEHDETIGWHLEQAHRHRRELGPLDAQGKTLGERAAQRLAAAGRRALARDDLPVAAGLLGRAIDRLDSEDPSRADLALDWCEALLAAGDVGTAQKGIDELGRFIGEDAAGQVPAPSPTHPLGVGEGRDEGTSGAGAGGTPASGSLTLPSPALNKRAGEASVRLRAWHTCFASQHTVLTAPQELQSAADAVAAAAEELAKFGDAAGEAKAHSVHAQALARLGKVGACEAALDQALAAARRAGDRRRANAVLAGAPLAALWGPSPVTRASGRCLDVVRVLRITQGAPAVESVALSCQGVLEALRGRTEAARRMLASARKMVEDLGIAHRLFEADAFAGRIAAMEGDTAGAERLLRSAYEGLRDLGLGIDAARAGALLARTLLAQDRVAEAESFSHESERLAGDDLQAAIAWRGVRAEALAKRGEYTAAIELAKAAVAIASATDALLDHAGARMALAAALRAAGRGAEANAEQRRAIELWEAKGATLLAQRVHSDRERQAPIVPPAAPIATPPAVRRRVRPNAATAMQNRFDAALAARDIDAIAAQFRADHQEIDHPTGSTYGRAACIASLQRLFRSRDPLYEVEPLATLGESLLLVRRRSGAAGTASARYDVGPYENEAIQLFEVDGSGLCRSAEVFAVDHLGDAIARFYERHAELLPEGPARERAAATARSVAVVAPGGFDRARYAEVFRSDVEIVDHKLLGLGAGVGLDTLFRSMAAGSEIADQVVSRPQDVLALTHDALLLRWLASGVGRESGGAFEWAFLRLLVFDADGRVARYELFDADGEAQALARFHALTRAPAARRRVRANAATRGFERFAAALAARDDAALAQLFDDSLCVVHHPSGVTYGRREMLGTWRSALKAGRLEFRHETLASLGDTLALDRHVTSVEGMAEADFMEVGVAEFHEISLIQADERARALHTEIFAADRLGEAIARLYQRYAELLPEGSKRERAAATARSMGTMLTAPVVVDRAATVMAPDFESVDHRPLSTWSMRGGGVFLEHLRALQEVANDIVIRVQEVLALEPNAVLVRRMHSGTERLGGGVYERPFLVLFATDGDGRLARAEWFDDDREAEALARFEEIAGDVTLHRNFLDNAATRARARFYAAWEAGDWSRIEAVLAAGYRQVDHTKFSQIEIGRDEQMTTFRHLRSYASSRFTGETLATRGERLALERVRFEAEGGDVGPSEVTFLVVTEVDEHGDLFGVVRYEADDLDAAYAELDARFEAVEAATHDAGTRASQPFANAATKLMAEQERAWIARDWDTRVASYLPTYQLDDRRSLMRMQISGEAFFTQLRMLFDLPRSRWHFTPLATRGESLALGRVVWEGDIDETGGPLVAEYLEVFEVDANGRCAASVLFDPDGLDAAYVELDRRYEAGEAAHAPTTIAFNRALTSQDWNMVAALCAHTFVEHDCRRLAVIGTTRGAEAWVRSLRTLTNLAPGTVARLEHVRVGARGFLNQLTWHGSREGGTYEIPLIGVAELDEREKIARVDIYDHEQFPQAQARFAELRAPIVATAARLANAATRAVDRGTAALAARDWEGFARLFAHGARHVDRTRMAQLESDIQEWLVSFRQIVEMTTAPPAQTLLATRGERLALYRMLWQGAEGDIGPSEIDWLLIVEVNERGDHLAVVVYDPVDVDTAYAELDARWAAGEASAHPLASKWLADYLRHFAARDWEAMATLFAADLFAENHRLVGWGTRHGPEGVVSTLRAQIELAPDTQERVDHVRTCERAVLFEYAWHGTLDGGDFENLWVVLVELDVDGRARRADVWEAERIDQALARLTEIAPSTASRRPAALMKPTTATAAMRRAWAAFDAGDLDAARALCTQDFVWEDRRPLVGLSGDVELMIASARERLATGARHERREVVGTAGDRIAIARVLWAGGPVDGRFEVEFLVVHEVDEAGLCTAMIFLDPDDPRAAQREAWARWAAIDPVAAPWVELLTELVDAWNARDLSRLRHRAADGLVLEDHRHAGLGRIEGVDAYGDSVVVLWDLAPDQRLEIGSWPAVDGHGFVVTARRVGTLTNGGAFESEYLWLGVGSAGRFTRSEFFEIEDLDAALARFEELRPPSLPELRRTSPGLVLRSPAKEDPLRIPPNAATRAQDQQMDLAVAGDWEAVRALHSPRLVFDDRRSGLRTTVDGEAYLAGLRWARPGRPESTPTVLATAGDRLELRHNRFTRTEDGTLLFEVDTLALTEVDADGRLESIILFDPDDRAAAEAELFERYVAGGGDGMPGGMIEYFRGVNGGDLARARTGLCDDFVLEDRRRTGMGRLEGGDAYITSVAAAHELTGELHVRPLYTAAIAPHGRVVMIRAAGTNTDGGVFESYCAALVLYRDERIASFEFFEPEDLDAALARLAECGVRERKGLAHTLLLDDSQGRLNEPWR